MHNDVVEHMAEAVWRSYGAGQLRWEDVHPYVQKQHRNDAIVALETALPFVFQYMFEICEELAEDSTVLTRVVEEMKLRQPQARE